MTEEWRAVAGSSGTYEVSNLGRVRSLDRRVPVRSGDNPITRFAPGRILKGTPDSHGHLRVYMPCKSPKQQAVHRLVAEAFLGPAPEDKPNVLHWDDDPTNNCVSNLRWGSQAENIADIVRNGNHFWRNQTHCVRGHELTPENTYTGRRGKSRDCKKCIKIRQSQDLKPDDHRHGSLAGYASGCRCEQCMTARRVYVRDNWRKKHGKGLQYRD